MHQPRLEAGLDGDPPRQSGAGYLGRDADVGQQTLLFRMESAVVGALQIQPLAVEYLRAGKSRGCIGRTGNCGVIARPVVRALPLHRPGDVPPWVQGGQCLCTVRRRCPCPGLDVAQPFPKPIGIDRVVLRDREIAVFAHVVAGMRQAGREGFVRLPTVSAPPLALRPLAAGPHARPYCELVHQRALAVGRSHHPHLLALSVCPALRPHALIRPREEGARRLLRQLFHVPGPPHTARNSRQERRQISQAKGNMALCLGHQTAPEVVTGQQRGQGNGLRIGHELPRHDLPRVLVQAVAVQAP